MVIFLDFRVDRLSGDMGLQVRVVVGPSGGRLAANLTKEGLLPGVDSHMVVQVVFAGELLVASRALEGPSALVLSNVTVQIRFVGERHA